MKKPLFEEPMVLPVSEHVKRASLQIVEKVAEDSFVIKPDRLIPILQELEAKSCSSILLVLYNQILVNALPLQKAIEVSEEMGWNMLSQKGMVSAMKKDAEMLLGVAASLSPDLTVTHTSAEDYEVEATSETKAPASETLREFARRTLDAPRT